MQMFMQYRGLPRDLYILAGARAIVSAGAFIMPLLTLILTRKMGLDSAQAGLLVTLGSMSYVPGSLLGGKLADLIGRKKVILGAEWLSGIAWLICGFFPDSLYIIPFIFLAYIAMGAVDPAMTALIADLSHPEQRKTAYSLTYLGHNLGIAIGPMIGGFLFLNHSQWMFWGDGITTLLASLLIVWWVRESKPSAENVAHDAREAHVEGPLWPVLKARPYLLWFTVANFLLVFSYAQLFFALPIHLAEVFGDLGARNFGLVMTVNAVTVLLLTPLVIYLTRRNHAIVNVAITGVFYVTGFGSIYFIESLWLFLATTLVWTVGEILSATNTNAYLASHSPQSHRGRINSILPLIFGMGFAVAPAVMGQVIAWYGSSRIVWPLVALTSTVGTLFMTLLAVRELRREQHSVSAGKESAGD